MIPDKLFINLKILSKIQKNGRISRSSDGIIALENENFYQSVKRFVTNDSRKQSIFEINSIINETIDCLNNIVNSKFMHKNYSTTDEYYKNCENISLILEELIRGKTGIENLKFTYTSDANISSQLDILIIKINSSVKDIQHKLTYFKSFLPENFKLELDSFPSPNYYNQHNQHQQQHNQHQQQHEQHEQHEQHQYDQQYDQQYEQNQDLYRINDELDEIDDAFIDMNNIDSVI